MTDLNVYLRQGSHEIYREIARFPPKGVKYSVSKLSSANDSGLQKSLKRAVWFNLTKFKPPAIKAPTNSNLVHSCYGTTVSNNVPWVVDVEHYASFANYHIKSLNNQNYRRQIEKLLSSDYCKKIMPWTFAAKKSIENFFRNSKINEKMEVVYPAIRERKTKKEKSEKIKLLVVNRYFLEKGGLHALKVFDALDKRFDIEMNVVSNTPKEIMDKYNGKKNIKFFYPNLSTEELFKNHYSKSDIFMQLTFSDTFGFVLLEAMSAGLSIVTTDMFSTPEIVEAGKNGFLAHSNFSTLDKNYFVKYHQRLGNWNDFLRKVESYNGNFLKDMISKTSMLVDDSSLRKSMGKENIKLVNSGKFSIKERNKKLKRIYEEALQ